MNDLSDLQPRSVSIQTSIGELRLFAQRFEDIGPFSTLSADDAPLLRLRSYLPHLVSRDSASDVDGARVSLDESSCQQLSDEDIERIAEAYLSLAAVRKIADEERLRSNPLERDIAEPATTYLDRLLRAQHDRQMEDPETTYAAFGERYGLPLSTTFSNLDRKSLLLKATAANFIDDHERAAQARASDERASIRAASAADEAHGPQADAPIGHSLPVDADQASADVAGREASGASKSDREAEVELMRNIGWITAQSANLLSGLSASATQFLREFAEAAQRSEAATRRLLRIAVAGIVVAALVSAAACVLTVMMLQEQREQQRLVAQWQESLLQTMKAEADKHDLRLTDIDTRLQQLGDHQQTAPGGPTSSAAEAVPRNGSSDAVPSVRRDASKANSPTRGVKKKATH